MRIKSALSIFAAATLATAPVSANSYVKPVQSPAPKQINSAECLSLTFAARYCRINPGYYMCGFICP